MDSLSVSRTLVHTNTRRSVAVRDWLPVGRYTSPTRLSSVLVGSRTRSVRVGSCSLRDLGFDGLGVHTKVETHCRDLGGQGSPIYVDFISDHQISTKVGNHDARSVVCPATHSIIYTKLRLVTETSLTFNGSRPLHSRRCGRHLSLANRLSRTRGCRRTSGRPGHRDTGGSSVSVRL